MKRVLSLMMAAITMMGAIAYAVDNTTEQTEGTSPISTEAPTTAPGGADITVDPETGEPEIEVKGTVLVKDVDYVLSYKDNMNIGTATVIVTFTGNYSGMREQTFNIVPKPTTKPSSGGGGGGGRSSARVTLAEASAKPTTEPVYLYHEAYINGYDDGTFRPDACITRAEATSMMSRVIPTATPTPEPTAAPNAKTKATQTPVSTATPIVFTDVKSTDWYYTAVTAMSTSGKIKGYNDGTFRPDTNISRAELVTMLIRGSEEKFVGVPFNDVFSNRWYADYIYTAYINKYINGYGDGTFRPDSHITRAEAVKIINRYLGRNDYSNESNPFKDVPDTHWAYKDISEAGASHKYIASEE